jgi:hypothetical protein
MRAYILSLTDEVELPFSPKDRHVGYAVEAPRKVHGAMLPIMLILLVLHSRPVTSDNVPAPKLLSP